MSGQKPLKLDEDRVLRCSAALGSQTRIELLLILRQRVASPSELSRERGLDAIPASLGTISYHVGKLVFIGAAKEVGRQPKRGTMEHFYDITEFGEECLNVAKVITKDRSKETAPGSAG